MEVSYGFFVVVLGLLYLAFLVVMWNVRSVETATYKIMLLVTIIVFSVMAGTYWLAALWGFNLVLQLLILGSILK